MPYLAFKDSSVGICDWTALPLGGRKINEKGTYYIYIEAQEKCKSGPTQGQPYITQRSWQMAAA